MPNYTYECTFCDNAVEEYRSIKDGPHTDKKCEVCEERMYSVPGTSFILVGGDWPSKEFRKDNTLGELAEKAEKFVGEHDGKKKEAAEVLSHRRQGRKHFDEWKRHNKPQVERYWKNKMEGFKGRQDAGVQVRKV